MFFVQIKIEGHVMYVYYTKYIAIFFFLSGSHAWSSSWRGNVANETYHSIIGKQMKSCELLQYY